VPSPRTPGVLVGARIVQGLVAGLALPAVRNTAMELA
jgi:hypothetical protein